MSLSRTFGHSNQATSAFLYKNNKTSAALNKRQKIYYANLKTSYVLHRMKLSENHKFDVSSRLDVYMSCINILSRVPQNYIIEHAAN